MVVVLKLFDQVLEDGHKGVHCCDLTKQSLQRVSELVRDCGLHHGNNLGFDLHFVVENFVGDVYDLDESLGVFRLFGGFNLVELDLNVLVGVVYAAYFEDLLLQFWRPLTYELSN